MTDNKKIIKVIGAGLAGVEASWQLAQAGYEVNLYEMRPQTMTPAHQTDLFAELVCSNSLRSNELTNAVGLLKEEMRQLGSLVMESADRNLVPAGGALAVDRQEFSAYITDKISQHPNIKLHREEVVQVDLEADLLVIATGPLTSDSLSQSIRELVGEDYLYFYDAAAPIVTRESIDFDKVFIASRYDRGEAAYINCPMTEEEFDDFYNFLIQAETAPLQKFEDVKVFEACMPIEVLAKRGRQTMTFGPLKPVGLVDPKTGEEAFAVIQLRQDNKEASLYNLVGFQTHLKWGEQDKLMALIPGLENAEIVRYGVMHRNTFINSPKLLNRNYQLKGRENIFFAGQITGVEGYVESASSGLAVGINALRYLEGREMIDFSQETAIGSLTYYFTDFAGKSFQPMNVNFGIFAPLNKRISKKKDRYQAYADRALTLIEDIKKKIDNKE